MENASRKRPAAKSWVSRRANGLQETFQSEPLKQFETNIGLYELETDIEVAAQFPREKRQILVVAKETHKSLLKADQETENPSVRDVLTVSAPSNTPHLQQDYLN
ncbi:hypothetical protein RRG08_042489 [Elysia crispata]|uniref:Uncharacterized protein n=1 Tax=Elysia crispata TaxID=231223 RepID=A0AAE0YDU2_9GAST|nr:hypothetical protein RRG08_042489 [Elysia crispata]